MTLRRALAVTAAALMATAGTLGITALPAQAVSCTAGTVCLHDPHQFGLPVWAVQGGTLVVNDCTNLSGFDNRVTSWQNTSGYRFMAYDGANCTGAALFTIGVRSSNSNIGTTANDRMTSIYWLGS